jgi:holo-[acyl-carrier protein] synthase
MSIIGLGIDIIEINRIEEAVSKFGNHFLNKIFTKAELDNYRRSKDYAAYLAARFAAKEAFYKACSLNPGEYLSFTSIEILNLPDGKPKIYLKENSLEKMSKMGGKSVYLSLTHSRISAAAVVIIES